MVQYESSFPYPVLGHENDVDSKWEFAQNPTFTPSAEDIVVRFRIRCDDPDLCRMIDHRSAKIVAEWQCSSTLGHGMCDLEITQTYSDGWSFSTVIDQRDVACNVAFKVYAITTYRIDNMSWKRQHPDYEGASFSLERGEYLAVPLQFDFKPDKIWDPANPPVASCIKIYKGEARQKESCKLDLSGDYIEIRVSEPVYNWMQLSGDAQLKLSLIVLPSLVEAIDLIKTDGQEDIQDREWAQTINRYLQNENTEERSVLLAQRILRDPVEQYIIQTQNEE